MKDWQIHGIEIANCNCAWGCPCQFNALPTTGQCEAVWAMRIDKGNFDGTTLDGLNWGFLVWWPGAVHEGNGRMQVFGEARATPAQRAALEAIASGRESDEGTYFQIFAAMAPNAVPPVWAPVEIECDLDSRVARLSVAGLIETKIEPIRNPMSGVAHRAQVTLPDGFEYKTAEYASGTTKTSGPISLDLRASHAHLAKVGWDAHRLIP
ncbi:MAG TPA: DUF1326 domain-containing protein [Candidatus Limnocylindrales bacterium]|nr:DUF1326 domain-containing protein [Candidatus Limnocylindrales bacterium]